MQLISEGKAGNLGYVWETGKNHDFDLPVYGAIDRYDLQRVDHFFLNDDDLDVFMQKTI